MYRFLFKTMNFFVLVLIIASCSQTRQIVVPSIIPAEMQQLIKSAKVDEIGYSFQPNSRANLCQFTYTYGGLTINNEVNINSPLRSLLDELIQTKFSKINNSSKDKIDIKITDIHSNNNALQLDVEAEISRDTVRNSKKFSYSMTYPYNSSDQPEAIHSFLIKYVVGIDKFIDNEFDVQ